MGYLEDHGFKNYEKRFLRQFERRKLWRKVTFTAGMTLLVVAAITALFMFGSVLGGKGTTLPAVAKNEAPNPMRAGVEERYPFNDPLRTPYLQDWNKKSGSTFSYAYPFSTLATFHCAKYNAWAGGLGCSGTTTQTPTQQTINSFTSDPPLQSLSEDKQRYQKINLEEQAEPESLSKSSTHSESDKPKAVTAPNPIIRKTILRDLFSPLQKML